MIFGMGDDERGQDPSRKGLGMLRSLDRSLKPLGAFERFEQESDVILSFYYPFFKSSLQKKIENACKERGGKNHL